MPNSKYFGIPFGTSGDKATIPEAVQPSGAISFTQGFGPDYERDPATDPLAKRVPRDETNELYYQITNTLRYLQFYGLPEWYDVDSTGADVSYPIAARVRHLDQAWVSLVATNTATPGSDATKWALDVAFSVAAVEATLAQMRAGVDATKLATPRRVASAVQEDAWNYAVATGTATALTANLAPAPLATPDGMGVRLLIAATNTGAATLNLNGLGAAPILYNNGSEVFAGELVAGQTINLVRLGASWRVFSPTEAILRLTPKGSRQTRLFISDVAANDLSVAPTLTTVASVSISGATYVDAQSTLSLVNGASGSLKVDANYRLGLYQNNTLVTPFFSYIGVSSIDGSRSGVTMRERFTGLNPALTYEIRVLGTKTQAVGPARSVDVAIICLHD